MTTVPGISKANDRTANGFKRCIGQGQRLQFFEVGDIALDGVEVGAVGREEQHLVPLLGGDGLRACFLWNEA